MIENDELLTTEQKLNMETAQILWEELQRLYAQGVVLLVSPELDLVQVGAAFVDDKAEEVKAWLDGQLLRKANDEDAMGWYESKAELWAVTAAPWVLVQPE